MSFHPPFIHPPIHVSQVQEPVLNQYKCRLYHKQPKIIFIVKRHCKHSKCSGMCNFFETDQKTEKHTSGSMWKPLELNIWIHACEVSYKRGGGITLFFWVHFISAVQYICKSKTTPQLLELFNCPQFSSHPARLSTRLVVFCVGLRDRAETTAACLFTFPLTAWSHSWSAALCCMDSDCCSLCCVWIN